MMSHDVTLLFEHEDEIQEALDIVQRFYLKRRLFPNTTKCEIVIFDPKKRGLKTTPKLVGNLLPKVHQITYLGQIFSDDAKFSSHIKNGRKKRQFGAGKQGMSPGGTAKRLYKLRKQFVTVVRKPQDYSERRRGALCMAPAMMNSS